MLRHAVHTCTCMSHDVEHVQYICVCLCVLMLKRPALATRDSFANFSSSSCGLNFRSIQIHRSTTWQIHGVCCFYQPISWFLCSLLLEYPSIIVWNIFYKKTAPGHSKHFPSNFNYNPWISDCSWCLSHTYRNPHSVWSLILAWDSWSFSCSIESQEFTQKIFNMWQKFWNRQRVSNQHVKFTTILQVSGNISP